MSNQTTTVTNVRTREETLDVISSVLNTTADIVGSTLGAYGENIILKTTNYEHVFSKDGYSVLDKILFKDEAKMMIFEIIKRISFNLVRKVGDGSTSAIVAAREIFNALVEKNKKRDMSPKEMMDILNRTIRVIESQISTIAKPFNEANYSKLKDISYVSCNNDSELGDIVFDICEKFPESSFINIEKSKSEETTYELEQGYSIHSGRVTNSGINSPHDLGCYYDDMNFIQYKGLLTKNETLQMLNIISSLFLNIDKPICIIASKLDMEAINLLNDFHTQNARKNFKMVIIESGNSTDDQIKRGDDLEEFLGCKAIDLDRGDNIKEAYEYEKENLFGFATRFFSVGTTSVFIGGKGYGSESFNTWCDELDKQAGLYAESINDSMAQRISKEIKLRAVKLRHGIATIYVGGLTEAEKESRKFLIDDAVNAIFAAKESGYVVGGNISIPYLLDRYKVTSDKEKELVDTLSKAFKSVYMSVLTKYTYSQDLLDEATKNAYTLDEPKIFNLTTSRFENANETNIISPAKTDIEIFKTAVNIVGHLLTTSHIVTTSYVKE
jgi:chaperonin GroEL